MSTADLVSSPRTNRPRVPAAAPDTDYARRRAAWQARGDQYDRLIRRRLNIVTIFVLLIAVTATLLVLIES
jgi:hypothetical protein